MEPTEKHHSALFFTAVFSLIIIIFALFIFVLMKQVKKTAVPGTATQYGGAIIPTVYTPQGTLKLIPKDGVSSYKAGDTVMLRLIAYSAGDPVTGYDAVLRYDTEKILFVKATSLNDDFQLFVDKKQPNVPLMLTGVKKLSASEPVVLSDTAIVELTFKLASVTEPRYVTFNLDFVPSGTKDSNLINEKTQDILGRVEGVVIQAGP